MSPGEALHTEIPEARRMENYRSGNCLLDFFDRNTKRFRNFTASQFGDVWNYFDQDACINNNVNNNNNKGLNIVTPTSQGRIA
ncbi:unnamed protein product [Trichobilharzia regenti]|nr:unnamed protein product [Trichobilharzia regenti]